LTDWSAAQAESLRNGVDAEHFVVAPFDNIPQLADQRRERVDS